MPLEKKLSWSLIALTAVGVVVSLILSPHSGRPAVLVMLLGGLAWFGVVRVAHARYASALRAAATVTGLAYLGGAADEKKAPFLVEQRLKAEADVFRWKVDGRYPALAGDYAGFPVVVRVPLGVNFDAAAPDATRIAAYHGVRLTGFTIYDRPRLKKLPKGRQATFDDAAFDARFLVLAHRPEEPQTVLGPEIRAALLEAGGVGFRGIEVNRYGVFLHEEGKVSSADLLRRRLELVTRVAAACRELAGAGAS